MLSCGGSLGVFFEVLAVFFLVIASLWKKFVGQGPAEKLVATVIKAIVPSGKGKVRLREEQNI